MANSIRSVALGLTLSIAIGGPVAAQATRGGMRGTPAQAREAVLLRMDAFGMVKERGYRLRRELTPRVTEFEIRGPSQAVPFESDGMDEVQLARRCTPEMRQSTPTCLRIDAIEIFTAIDPGTRKVVLSVVPHTFTGADANTFLEVPAASDVVADAQIIARRFGGKVVPAIPWPRPTRSE